MDQIHASTSADDGRGNGAARVEELMRAIAAALRNHRLYGGDGPNVERFRAAAAASASGVWEIEDEIRLDVAESSFSWNGRVVFPGPGDGGDLPFLFYKDGIRTLVLSRGLETSIGELIEVIARASQVRSETDDLVTLLWEADVPGVGYEVVELAAGAGEMAGGGEPPASVDGGVVRSAAEEPPPPDRQGFSTDDFEETLYFLDDAELRRLAGEVRKEQERDLWGEVLNALFDRIEDGSPERQVRILRILSEVLPSMLAAGRIDRAAGMLAEVVDLAAGEGRLPAEGIRAVRALVEVLGSAAAIEQLVLTLEDAPAAASGEHLSNFLGYFPPSALPELMRAAERISRPDVKEPFERAIERLATSGRDVVVALLDDGDPRIVQNAARWVGRLGAGEAVPALVRRLGDPSPETRLATVGALRELRASKAGGDILPLIEDESREVRMATLRALSALGYAPARKALEDALASRSVRGAERTEKLAFYETYGRIGGRDAIALLERTLNGKSWLGKTEPSDARACAALALARIPDPAAREALLAAANDEDPVVRTAVARALRGDAQ